MSSGSKIGIAAMIVMGLLLLTGIWAAGTYNALIREDQAVRSQWAQVENVYQRRQDLVPNLVETVKGAAGNLVAGMSGARFQDTA